MSNAEQRFIEAAAALGFTADVRTMDQSTHTAQEAAAAVGCDVGAIVKSLVFLADGAPLLVLVSGPNRVDTDVLGRELGAVIEKSDAKRVKAETGYSIGGVPPFGHPVTLRTVIDPDLLRYDDVWAAAGSPTAVFRIDPDALLELTGGAVANIS
ncbi:prolyl-tRNA editing enzyme YbaK/EbsC (Cys-tRNA(Pro) deacylase) [Cryobacterium mesophilum]|uniref:YbaK/EbsC family protein n=1 Tax=Terrimesophilobacter mesophilus TaxID=433647 RepID=A0A4R8V9W3_9MICO|nr:YbaK/EbsC family protein [Terrimesophilobacter mesophilus]MBB5631961.1 prolyl-tRNA editing enzyme YbaK/EbsC (Cys-tRNA(Pro) deacylase) [Terrimesophilobacter mesophilus]TFB78860.1 YbaK/EbsC family protein [Terrimesophilobacter mesophilus]